MSERYPTTFRSTVRTRCNPPNATIPAPTSAQSKTIAGSPGVTFVVFPDMVLPVISRICGKKKTRNFRVEEKKTKVKERLR